MDSQVQIWGQSDNGEYEYVTLTPSLLDKALDVIRVGFIPNESVSIACGIPDDPEAGEELIELCREVAKDGVSLVAVHKTSGEVVSVAFNKIQTNNDDYYEKFAQKCKTINAQYFIRNMFEVDDQINLFTHCGVDVILEIMFIATKPEAKRRGLSKGLCAATISLTKYLRETKGHSHSKAKPGEQTWIPSQIPDLVCIQCTSFASQNIAQQLNFEKVATISFDNFFFKGKKYSELVDPNISDSIILEVLNV